MDESKSLKDQMLGGGTDKLTISASKFREMKEKLEQLSSMVYLTAFALSEEDWGANYRYNAIMFLEKQFDDLCDNFSGLSE